MTRFTPTSEQLAAAIKRCLSAHDSAGADRAAEELMTRAFESLDTDKTASEAFRIGDLLQNAGHPSGYEITAIAWQHTDQVDRAVEVLRKGVDNFPAVSRLWAMLGACCADNQQAEQAICAFENALSCTDVDEPSVRYEFSLALQRAKKPSRALDVLNKVTVDPTQDPEFAMTCSALKAGLLNGCRRYDEAIDLAADNLEKVAAIELSEYGLGQVAELHAQVAHALLHRGDPKGALDHARKAIHLDQGNSAALLMMRTISPVRSPDAKLITLIVKGTWTVPFDGHDEPSDFYQTFAVVADCEDEALGYALQLSPDELRASMSIEQSEVVKPAVDEPKGVVQVSPYVFLTEMDDEESTAD